MLVCVLCLHTSAGVTGYPHNCAYAASKHAVVGMMRCAAAEYGPLGLRINCINPGATGEHMTSIAVRGVGTGFIMRGHARACCTGYDD
jgi:NAD(P)-dependent dehydrogenase (short-subunit alcohol dehydrogenase family)